MKLLSTIGAIVVLCAGYVQMTCPKLVKIKVVKEVPGMKLQYAIETEKKPGSLSFQDMKKDMIELKYHDEDPVERLHVKKMNDVDSKTLALLKAAEQTKKQYDLIVINEAAVPRYVNKQEYDKLKALHSKSKEKVNKL